MKIVVTIPFGDLMHQHDSVKCARIFQNSLLNKDWWNYRASILRDYVLPSLHAQTANSSALILATFHPDTLQYALPVVKELKESKAIISTSDRDTSLRNHFWNDDVVMIHLDSDDMYEKTTIAEMAKVCRMPGDTAILREGYYFDITSGKMAEVDMPGPPFFAQFYTKDSLFSEQAMRDYQAKWFKPFHHEMYRCKRVVVLKGKRYCQTIHGMNTSSSWNNPNTKNKIRRMIDNPEYRNDILKRFGVFYNATQ